MDKLYFERVIYKNKSNRLREGFIKNNFSEFYDFVNLFNGDSFLEKLFIFYNGLTDKVKCKNCLSNNVKFISFNKGYLNYCSYKCSSTCIKVREKYNNTCIEKYGVNNVSKNSDIKNKKKDTFIEKYGVSTYLLTKDVKDIIKDKYGVKNVFELDYIQEKIKSTNIKKYGFSCALLNPAIKNKTKETNIKKYGTDHYSKTIISRERIIKKIYDKYSTKIDNNYEVLNKNKHINTIKHKICEKVFEIQTQLIRKRKNNNSEICLICNPIKPSYGEFELSDFIRRLGVNVINKYRDKYEIDVYVPELNIGFEFNGLYWHSELFLDNDYHLVKSEYFKKKGIKIFHIWEDDWKHKNEIIKSIVTNKLNINKNKNIC
jgi:hypothetical protein